MTGTAKILSVVTAQPPYSVEADELKRYIRANVSPASAERLCRIFDKSEVRKRHIVAPFAELRTLRTVEDRTRRFMQHSLEIGESVARQALMRSGFDPRDITTLISVSTTGYMSPSLDAHLVERLGLRSTVRRLPITQLGCSAGVAAIGTAADLMRGSPSSALVVSVELCSLALQNADPSPTDLIASILFGDGAAATVVSTAPGASGLEILGSRSVLLHASLDRVGIQPSTTGLRLILSREVPSLIVQSLPDLLGAFLEANALDASDLTFLLAHPGGPRVLEAVARSLAVPHSALAESWEVWRECGNMSSATSLFVLERWLRSIEEVRQDQVGLLLALGPGVSCEMILLRTGAAGVPAASSGAAAR